MDIYPTVVELAEQPLVMGRSIRTERWRYTDWEEDVRSEQRHDHYSDPMELNTLAIDSDTEAQAVIARLLAP